MDRPLASYDDLGYYGEARTIMLFPGRLEVHSRFGWTRWFSRATTSTPLVEIIPNPIVSQAPDRRWLFWTIVAATTAAAAASALLPFVLGLEGGPPPHVIFGMLIGLWVGSTPFLLASRRAFIWGWDGVQFWTRSMQLAAEPRRIAGRDGDFEDFVREVRERIEFIAGRAKVAAQESTPASSTSPERRVVAPDLGPPSAEWVERRAAWVGRVVFRLYGDRVEVVVSDGWFSGSERRIDFECLDPRPQRTEEAILETEARTSYAVFAVAVAGFAALCTLYWREDGRSWYEHPEIVVGAVWGRMLVKSVLLRVPRFAPRRPCVRFQFDNGAPAFIMLGGRSAGAEADAFVTAVSRQAAAFRGLRAPEESVDPPNAAGG